MNCLVVCFIMAIPRTVELGDSGVPILHVSSKIMSLEEGSRM